VRFGNVLASKGSVVPLFERQLAAGGPITVTHPLAERFFMTIPDAAHLVLQVGSLPEAASCIAMVDMGEPVRIVDLADRLIRFSGKIPCRDVSIMFTGLRPGEKLAEDLDSAMQASIPTSNGRIRISQTTESEGSGLVEGLIRLLACVESGNRNGLLATLCELVPECVAPLRKFQPTELGLEPSRSSPAALSGWGTMIQSLPVGWRDRRRPAAPDPEPDCLRLDRRRGAACRRKAARAGGRRRTDVVESLQLGQMIASR
jgi:O-antigen biosynthesis protein WbqV